MPIYAYRCEACGFAKDVLQKISDPQLTECPSCGQASFKKQVTAAGFQLKGTGWYVTDFRGGNSGGNATTSPAKPNSEGAPAASDSKAAGSDAGTSSPASDDAGSSA